MSENIDDLAKKSWEKFTEENDMVGHADSDQCYEMYFKYGFIQAYAMKQRTQDWLDKFQADVGRLSAENLILKAELELARSALSDLATIYEDQKESERRANEILERN